jgi:predicted transcriptional regulator
MTAFTEQLQATLDAALAERETFNSEWNAKRKSVVDPTLQTAKPIFDARFALVEVKPENGAIFLWVAMHRLVFRPNQKILEVECVMQAASTSGERVSDSYGVGAITQALVEKKLLEFAQFVARNQ